MKISIIKEAIDRYDGKRGLIRALAKDEPHIRDLRTFYAKLPTIDRDLTLTELYELVLICLCKTSTNGSASCESFDFLFTNLGKKEVYSFLQKENLLDKDSAFFVLSQKDNNDSIYLLYLLVGCKQQARLSQLFQFNEEKLELLRRTLLLLKAADETLLTDSLISSCFAASPNTLINFGHFLLALSTIKQLNQPKLDLLVANFDKLKTGTCFKRVLDYIFSAQWNMSDYIDLVLKNGSEMEKALDMMQSMPHNSDAQKELLFHTLLMHPQWYARIFAGIKKLSPKNADFYETVLSQPEHANMVAKGVEEITQSCPHSTKPKKDYAIWVRKNAQYVGDLIVIMNYMSTAHICNPPSICKLLALQLNFQTLLKVVQNLNENSLLDQGNFDLLVERVTSQNIGLILSKSSTLAEYYQLEQDSFEKLLNSFRANSNDSQYEETSELEGSSDGSLFGSEINFFGRRSGQTDNGLSMYSEGSFFPEGSI